MHYKCTFMTSAKCIGNWSGIRPISNEVKPVKKRPIISDQSRTPASVTLFYLTERSDTFLKKILSNFTIGGLCRVRMTDCTKQAWPRSIIFIKYVSL